jgi:hypothetical protein
MPFRDDRLRDVLAVKGLNTHASIHHRTDLPYPQIRRYTAARGSKDFGLPNVETLAVISVKLEIDADYLLGSDARYDEMSTVHAAAHMALDRYVTEEAANTRHVSESDLASLRLIATNHSRPPVWIEEWRREHESIRLRQLAAAPSSQAVRKPTS